MKTIKITTGLLLSALLFTACTPQDKAVVDDNTRAKINARKTRTNFPKKDAANDFSLGNYALSGYLVERQIEAVELVKVAMGTLNGVEKQYRVDEVKNEGGDLDHLKMSSNSSNLEYEAANGRWKTRSQRNYEVRFVNPESQLQFEVSGKDLKTYSDALDKEKNFVNMLENSYTLSVGPVAGDEAGRLLEVVVKSNGLLKGAKGQGIRNHALTLDIKMIVEQESLLAGDVRILETTAQMTYPGSAGRTFNSKVSGENLTLQAEANCHKMTGQLSGEAGPKTKFSVAISEDSLSINKSWTKNLATCGTRPTVDYGRLLIY